MAIRRIIDLPDLGSEPSYEPEKFLKSKFEVSYLSDLSGMTYVSRSVSGGALVDAIVSAMAERQKLGGSMAIKGHLSAEGGLALSGDFLANAGSAGNQHVAEMVFDETRLSSDAVYIKSSETVSLDAGGAEVTLGDNAVRMSPTATVDVVDEANGRSVVNMDTLRQGLSDLSAKLIRDIEAGVVDVAVKQKLDFPLLGIVYLDHKIESDNWKLAGSTVDLSQYSALREYLDVHPDILDVSAGAWKYSRNGNELVLPSNGWFFQCISDQSEKPSFVTEGLPDITGQISGIRANFNGATGAFSVNGEVRSESGD